MQQAKNGAPRKMPVQYCSNDCCHRYSNRRKMPSTKARAKTRVSIEKCRNTPSQYFSEEPLLLFIPWAHVTRLTLLFRSGDVTILKQIAPGFKAILSQIRPAPGKGWRLNTCGG